MKTLLSLIISFALAFGLHVVCAYIRAFWEAGVFRLKWVQWRAAPLIWLSERARKLSVWLAGRAFAITSAYLNSIKDGPTL